MNAENEKLKQMLSHVTNNYSALQFHIATLMQQQKHEAQAAADDHATAPARQFMAINPSSVTADNELQVSNNSSSEERTKSVSPPNNENGKRIGREESPESETWGPNSNKVQKLGTNPPSSNQTVTESTMRKARVSVRARSEATMISDGCQWRKYGQKIAKGNPCPRAYYRCTMAVGCPVRKQVQRCAEDRAILITSYEGNHNHPLPPAAMAMASTTTAAASMLLSGSMSSADTIMNPNMLARSILPNSANSALSMATISASAPFPTVTLDLTHSQFQNRPSPAQFQVPSPAPQGFGQTVYNQSKFSGLQLSNHDVGSSQLGNHAAATQQHRLSAATAAIAADPNFTAALAAAISSIMNNNGNTSNN
jgi:hypothetical protein